MRHCAPQRTPAYSPTEHRQRRCHPGGLCRTPEGHKRRPRETLARANKLNSLFGNWADLHGQSLLQSGGGSRLPCASRKCHRRVSVWRTSLYLSLLLWEGGEVPPTLAAASCSQHLRRAPSVSRGKEPAPAPLPKAAPGKPPASWPRSPAAGGEQASSTAQSSALAPRGSSPG